MNKFDVLFKVQKTENWIQGEIEKISILSGRSCETGLMAFGYPYIQSGGVLCLSMYGSNMVITEQDIPALLKELVQRGFELARMVESDEDGGALVFLNAKGKVHYK